MDNKIAESDESFEVFLELLPNSSSDVILGEPSVATVTIYDDEVPSENSVVGYFYSPLHKCSQCCIELDVIFSSSG